MGRTKLPVGAAGEISVFPITKDGKSRYRASARFRDLDGRLVEINRIRDTKGAARAAVRDGIADRLKPELAPSVRTLIEEFVSGLPKSGLAVKTQQDYTYAASWLVDMPIADIACTKVSVGVVKATLDAASGARGTGGAKHARAVLRHALESAVEREEIASNPVAMLKSKTPVNRKRKGVDRRVLTDDELAEFLGKLYADPEALPMSGPRKGRKGERHVNGTDVADLTAFLFATGCRVGEALALRWQDIDHEEGVADISGTVTRVTGVGVVRQPRTKTAGSTRYVPLPMQILAMLENRKHRLEPVPEDAPVFGSPQKPLVFRDPNNLSKKIRLLFDRHGVDWAATHLGRRYRVTSLAEKGIPAHKIADLVGHSSVGTTMRYLGRSKEIDPQVRAAL